MKAKTRTYAVIGLYIVTVAVYLMFGSHLIVSGAATSKKWLVVELALLLAPLLGATLLRGKQATTEREKRRVIASSLWVLFSFYLLMLISMLFLGSRVAFGFSAQRVNLVPLASIREYLTQWHTGEYTYTWTVMFNNLIGNLLLFAPMAVLLPCLFDGMRRLAVLLPSLAGMILLVEIVQLFTGTGVCDVDDFLLNFAGAAATALVFRLPFVVRLLQKWHCYRADAAAALVSLEEPHALAA